MTRTSACSSLESMPCETAMTRITVKFRRSKIRIAEISGESARIVHQDDIEWMRLRHGSFHHSRQSGAINSRTREGLVGIDLGMYHFPTFAGGEFTAFAKLVIRRQRVLHAGGKAEVRRQRSRVIRSPRLRAQVKKSLARFRTEVQYEA